MAAKCPADASLLGAAHMPMEIDLLVRPVIDREAYAGILNATEMQELPAWDRQH
jgi:hypothetical protein